jgi:membrane protein implicated in regulation of membrane protease activity
MNESWSWILWTVLGVMLVIAEIFTPGFVLLWFGVGALAAAFASFLGAGLATQFILFIAVSSALTALSRTIFVNYFAGGRREPARRLHLRPPRGYPPRVAHGRAERGRQERSVTVR